MTVFNAGYSFELLREVNDVLDAGSRWRVASVETTSSALLHRIGKNGKRKTSKYTINEYRIALDQLEWLRSRAYLHAIDGGE